MSTKQGVEVTLTVDKVEIAGVTYTKSKTPTVNVSQATAHNVGSVPAKKKDN